MWIASVFYALHSIGQFVFVCLSMQLFFGTLLLEWRIEWFFEQFLIVVQYGKWEEKQKFYSEFFGSVRVWKQFRRKYVCSWARKILTIRIPIVYHIYRKIFSSECVNYDSQWINKWITTIIIFIINFLWKWNAWNAWKRIEILKSCPILQIFSKLALFDL